MQKLCIMTYKMLMILMCSVVMSLTMNKNGAKNVTCLERVRMKGNCLIFFVSQGKCE